MVYRRHHNRIEMERKFYLGFPEYLSVLVDTYRENTWNLHYENGAKNNSANLCWLPKSVTQVTVLLKRGIFLHEKYNQNNMER